MFRNKVLDIKCSVGIDRETSKNLRILKGKLKKSMAQIIKDLVEEKINLIK